MQHTKKKGKQAVEYALFEVLKKGNLDSYEEFVAKDVTIHHLEQPLYPLLTLGSTKAKHIDKEHSKAFYIHKLHIDTMIEEKKQIAVRWRFEGNHHQTFFHIPASHQEIRVSGQTIYTINEEDKIATVWQAWDVLGLLKQLNKPSEKEGKLHLLSLQEKRCIQFLLLGKTSKETASAMNLSHRTVEFYFENIKNKLQCHTKKEIFLYAYFLEKNGSL